jgi:hypothetical protein
VYACSHVFRAISLKVPKRDRRACN